MLSSSQLSMSSRLLSVSWREDDPRAAVAMLEERSAPEPQPCTMPSAFEASSLGSPSALLALLPSAPKKVLGSASLVCALLAVLARKLPTTEARPPREGRDPTSSSAPVAVRKAPCPANGIAVAGARAVPGTAAGASTLPCIAVGSGVSFEKKEHTSGWKQSGGCVKRSSSSDCSNAERACTTAVPSARAPRWRRRLVCSCLYQKTTSDTCSAVRGMAARERS
mmetsp:Transcript_13324/g.34160  ORF Transcript_13324/g.34160 Transcript_13324/m.34160 type:complete len:223 (+) Transcript_13324:472-1140(+)